MAQVAIRVAPYVTILGIGPRGDQVSGPTTKNSQEGFVFVEAETAQQLVKHGQAAYVPAALAKRVLETGSAAKQIAEALPPPPDASFLPDGVEVVINDAPATPPEKPEQPEKPSKK